MTEDPTRLLRNLSVYSALALVTLIVLYVSWSLLMGINLEILVFEDADLAASVESLRQQHGMGETTVREILKIAGGRLNWFVLAALASLVTFPIVGFLAGRYAPDPSWAGILPLLDLVSGMNPILPRVTEEIPKMPLDEQVFLLIFQVLITHAAAQWSQDRLAARREPAP